MSNTQTLRMNGYSASDAGIICHRSDGRRFAHERVGIVKVDLSRDSRDARALVDAVISKIDEPRALTGRDRRGGCVMLFRVDQWIGINNQQDELVLRDGTQISIVFGSDGLSVDPDLYSFPKGRAPADVARDSLPPLYPEFAEIAHSAAWGAGARSAEDFERERATNERIERLKADLAAGKIKLTETDAERAEREARELVAANEGADLSESDGIYAQLVLRARRIIRGKAQAA